MIRLTGSSRARWFRLFGIPFLIALTFWAFTVVTSLVNDLPFRDPVQSRGTSYIIVPLIVVTAIVIDVIVRTVLRRPAIRDIGRTLLDVLRTRCTRFRLAGAAAGAASAYLTYLAYRNLKVFLPTLQNRLADENLLTTDRWLGFGHPPSGLLHQLLGTGIASQVLSSSYTFFMIFIPLSLALALIWSSDSVRGAWYTTAICFNWIIGIISYYAIPSLGPIYVEPHQFNELPVTGVSNLQDSLHEDRWELLLNPHTTDAISGIAAFASLHVSIVFTALLLARRARVPKSIELLVWVYLGLTCLSTIYFGWHYVVDDIAGFGVGALAVWLAGRVVGRPDPTSDIRRWSRGNLFLNREKVLMPR